MLNQCILVGKIVNVPFIKMNKDNVKEGRVTLAIKREYKEAGTDEYESDYIEVILKGSILDSVSKYCGAGSTIGVTAKATTGYIDVIGVQGEAIKLAITELIVDKATFITVEKRRD